jgi:uncharacterized membrane protein YczE
VADEVSLYAAKYGVPTAIAVVAVSCRVLFSADRWTLLGITRDVLVGLFVGMLANEVVWELPNWTSGEKCVAIAVCAILAADIVSALLAFGRKLREDPMIIIETIRGWRKP